MTLDEIRALDKAATPGPWTRGPFKNGTGCCYVLADIGSIDELLIADCPDRRNSEFIAAARSLLLPLAEENAQLAAERDSAVLDAMEICRAGMEAMEQRIECAKALELELRRENKKLQDERNSLVLDAASLELDLRQAKAENAKLLDDIQERDALIAKFRETLKALELKDLERIEDYQRLNWHWEEENAKLRAVAEAAKQMHRDTGLATTELAEALAALGASILITDQEPHRV